MYRGASGEKLSLEVRSYAQRDIHLKTLFPLTDSWQKLGVEAQAVALPAQQANDAKEQATFPSFLVLRQPNGLPRMVQIHSTQARVPENNYQGSNNGRYRSAELDALIDRYQMTIPLAERMGVVAQIIKHDSENLPILPLFYDAQPTLISNRFVNVQSGINQTWNVQDWDLKN